MIEMGNLPSEDKRIDGSEEFNEDERVASSASSTKRAQVQFNGKNSSFPGKGDQNLHCDQGFHGQLKGQTMAQQQILRSAEASKQMVYEVFGNCVMMLEELDHRKLERNGIKATERSDIYMPDQTKFDDATIQRKLDTQLILLKAQLTSCNEEIKEGVKEELKKLTHEWMLGREYQKSYKSINKYAAKMFELLETGHIEYPKEFDEFGQHSQAELDKKFRQNPDKAAKTPKIRKLKGVDKEDERGSSSASSTERDKNDALGKSTSKKAIVQGNGDMNNLGNPGQQQGQYQGQQQAHNKSQQQVHFQGQQQGRYQGQQQEYYKGQQQEQNQGRQLEPHKGQQQEQNQGRQLEPHKGQQQEQNQGRQLEPHKGQQQGQNQGRQQEYYKGQQQEQNQGRQLEPHKGQQQEQNQGRQLEPHKGQQQEQNQERQLEPHKGKQQGQCQGQQQGQYQGQQQGQYQMKKGQQQGQYQMKKQEHYQGQQQGQCHGQKQCQYQGQQQGHYQGQQQGYYQGHQQGNYQGQQQGHYQGQQQGYYQGQQQGYYQGQQQGYYQGQQQGYYKGQQQGQCQGQQQGQYQGQQQGQYQMKKGQQQGQYQMKKQEHYQGQQQGQYQGQQQGQYQMKKQEHYQGQQQGQYQGQQQGQYQMKKQEHYQGQQQGQYQGQQQGQYQMKKQEHYKGQQQGQYQMKKSQQQGQYQGQKHGQYQGQKQEIGGHSENSGYHGDYAGFRQQVQTQEQLQRSAQASKQMVYEVFGNCVTMLEELEHRELKLNGIKPTERSDIYIPDQTEFDDATIQRKLDTQLILLKAQLTSCNENIKECVKEDLETATLEWASGRGDHIPDGITDKYAAKMFELLYTGHTDYPKEFDLSPKISENDMHKAMQGLISGQHHQAELDKKFKQNPGKDAKGPKIRKSKGVDKGADRIAKAKPYLSRNVDDHRTSLK